MFKRCKVVQLSTNQKAPIFLWYLDGIETGLASLAFTLDREMCPSYKPQHLYIISDDEIKEGDWFVDNNYFSNDKIRHLVDSRTNELGGIYIHFDNCHKIIASTDSSLNFPEPKLFDHNTWWTGRDSKMYFPCLSDAHTYWRKHKMPSPSQGFLKKYVSEYNKGNIIRDVKVEYYISNEVFREGKLIFPMAEKLAIYTPKVNSKDNTITIKKNKDSWTREEVFILCRGAFIESAMSESDRKTNPDLYKDQTTISLFDKWIEQNL